MIYDWYLWLVFVKSFLKAKGLGVENMLRTLLQDTTE